MARPRPPQCHAKCCGNIPGPKRARGVYLSLSPSCSSLGRIRTSLFMGLVRVLSCVLTTTDRTRPWTSDFACSKMANDQALRGELSSRIITISPATRFCCGSCHLRRSCIATRYSLFHRRRMYTSFFRNFPSGGNITVDLEVRIWLVVSGSRSSRHVVKGLELIMAQSHT